MKSAIAEQNLEWAKKGYQELYKLYHEINASSLEHIHKEVAYQQVVSAYHAIEDLKAGTMNPTNVVAIAIVLVIISTMVFINPRMIGLAIVDILSSENKAPVWSGEPQKIAVSGEIAIDLARSFSDPDGDSLRYQVVPSKGVSTSMAGSVVTAHIDTNIQGEKSIDIFVSDDKATTHATIALVVK